jgi:hypothetical protein
MALDDPLQRYQASRRVVSCRVASRRVASRRVASRGALLCSDLGREGDEAFAEQLQWRDRRHIRNAPVCV